MTSQLPVADRARVRRAVVDEIRADKRVFARMVALNALAAPAGLVGPWLLGDIVDTVVRSPDHSAVARVDGLALAILVATAAQTVLARFSFQAAYRFGEGAAARIRERFLGRALAVPASVAERAATGDLAARGTADTTRVADVLRTAIPEVVVASAQASFLVAAVVLVDPLLGVCALASSAAIAFVLRWYLRRAHTAYLQEGHARAELGEVLTSTAAGARTVEALGLQRRRAAAAETAIAESRRTALRTLRLRTALFPSVDVAHVLPLVAVLVVGGVLVQDGRVSLGAVVTAALYLRLLSAPLDTIMLSMDALQAGGASFARVEGLAAAVRSAPAPAGGSADGVGAAVGGFGGRAGDGDGRLTVADVHFAYGDRGDVLRGVDLDVPAGERLAVVGPSGAGKSTLGRLLAGLEEPRTGSVAVDGVAICDLPPERLRHEVVLVTQEHHVFRDTLRRNLLIARPAAADSELEAALAAVGADWAAGLPDGLGTDLGDDAHRLDAAQAQQVALARVVLADPATVVLDEATAMLDPRAARSTERALAAALEGRRVVAIAHRLQTAHDADRIAVLERGRVTELGGHGELMGRDGTYAALWRSWQGGDATAAR